MSHDDQTSRIHDCGTPMLRSNFGPHDPTPQNRSQPIWVCQPCNAWVPRDGWDGPLPEAGDGQTWSGGDAR